MTARPTPEEVQRTKRDLRLRIGRARRRIDQRLRGIKDDSRKMLSWRTYVAYYPGWTLLAALGSGLMAAAGFKSKRPSRWLGSRLVRQALRQITRRMWAEGLRVWRESGADAAARSAPTGPEPNGANDG